MPNALIYSPDFDGHRQVHVFVYTNLLEELGFKIFITGNFRTLPANSYYIDKIKSNKNIILKDTSIYEKNGYKIKNEEFIELQKEYNIDLTIFAEADNHIPLFTSQILNKKKRLTGKTVALFFRPFYYYERLSFYHRLRYLKNLFSRWRRDSRFFFETLLKRFNLLDKVLFLDENFVSHHKYSRYLPDVFQQYAETLVEIEYPEQRNWIESLNDFKKKNRDKFIFLYFGTAQKRRGYDLLLKISVELNACFIHCGLNNEKDKYDFDIAELKENLSEKDRLFETNQYISDPACLAHFFKSVDHLVLPYRDFWGSSGVMLQALSYGIPILVPDKGLMGYLVKKYKLGLTYASDSDITSISRKIKKFIELPSENFSNTISEYMKNQTPEQLKKKLVDAFLR